MTNDLSAVLEQLADTARPARTIDLEPFSDLTRGESEAFLRTWDRLGAARRLELITAMVEQAEVNLQLDFHTVLRLCLRDDDARVRKVAIDGLWEDERPNLAPTLVDLLHSDPVGEVRAAAATSLGRFILLGVLGEISERLAELAEEALRGAWDRPGETIEVRRRALESLSYTSTAGILDLIRTAYTHDNALMRQSAIFAMGRNADPRWNRIVLAELNSDEPPMRFEAVVAAGEMALRTAVRPLMAALEDPDVQVREAAVSALGKIGGPVARRALRALVADADEPLAEVAAEALDELTFESDGLEDLILDRAGPGKGRPSIAADDPADWDSADDFGDDEDDLAEDDEDLDWEDDSDDDLDEAEEDEFDWDEDAREDEADGDEDLRREASRSRWALR